MAFSTKQHLNKTGICKRTYSSINLCRIIDDTQWETFHITTVSLFFSVLPCAHAAERSGAAQPRLRARERTVPRDRHRLVLV